MPAGISEIGLELGGFPTTVQEGWLDDLVGHF